MENTINNNALAETQQATNTQPEVNGEQQRTFTQDEVNRIISERLSRKANNSVDVSEYVKRIDELEAKESKSQCQAYLRELNLPEPIADVLDTSNVVDFKLLVGKLLFLFTKQKPTQISGYNPGTDLNDALKDVFKPKL